MMEGERISVLGVIASCPFCGGSRGAIHAWNSHGRHFAVICQSAPAMCEARGPRRYDAQSAIDAWNERAGQ